MTFSKKLDKKTKEITDLLKSKNKAYGNSALNPANIFSQANAIDSLCARIDDKLMRIKNKGIYDATEDTVNDLIGYLMLLLMAIEDRDVDEDYESFKETLELGGHVNINGRPISSIKALNDHYKK
tara:strand:+ start:11632 stop:12006 length:375 start_codon:yes stop_codon:yes gene_type:complete